MSEEIEQALAMMPEIMENIKIIEERSMALIEGVTRAERLLVAAIESNNWNRVEKALGALRGAFDGKE